MLRENFLKEVKGFIGLEKRRVFKDQAKKRFFLECFFERKEKFLRNDWEKKKAGDRFVMNSKTESSFPSFSLVLFRVKYLPVSKPSHSNF